MKLLKGFTLVELLVVIAIIAVLLAILLPALSSVKEKGKRIQCGYNLSGINRAINYYCDDNAGALPWLRDGNWAGGPDIEAHPYAVYIPKWLKKGSATELLPMKLACLYASGLVTNPKLFYCPAATSITYKWESYCDPMPWEKLPKKVNAADSGNTWVRTSYIFRPMDKEYNKVSRTYGYAEKLVDVNYNKPWVTDTLWSRGSLNHVAGNRNASLGVYAAFPDSHVNFCSNSAMFSDIYWQNDTTELRPDTWQFNAVLNLMEP
jgi:prepilin-type N-terminal cleavage/methylation domain-containing protein